MAAAAPDATAAGGLQAALHPKRRLPGAEDDDDGYDTLEYVDHHKLSVRVVLPVQDEREGGARKRPAVATLADWQPPEWMKNMPGVIKTGSESPKVDVSQLGPQEKLRHMVKELISEAPPLPSPFGEPTPVPQAPPEPEPTPTPVHEATPEPSVAPSTSSDPEPTPESPESPVNKRPRRHASSPGNALTRTSGGGAAGAKAKQPRSATGYHGVSWLSRERKFVARVYERPQPGASKTHIHLAGYWTPEEAARAYDRAALVFWGRDSVLNFGLDAYAHELEYLEQMTREEIVFWLRRTSPGFARGQSVYRGVTRSGNQPWEAHLCAGPDGKYRYLGRYNSQREAAVAYDYGTLQVPNPIVRPITNFPSWRYFDPSTNSLRPLADCLAECSLWPEPMPPWEEAAAALAAAAAGKPLPGYGY